MAVGVIDALEFGVYIAMHGKVIEWNKCTRNKNGQFCREGISH